MNRPEDHQASPSRSGVFREAADRRVEEFTESVSFDRRLYAHDIRASIAHAQMLAAVGLIDDIECQQIVDTLGDIRRAIDEGRFEFRTELEDIPVMATMDDDELLQVNEALDELTAHDARKASVVKLRYIVGMTTAETAAVLGISEPTVKRDWDYAKAWLYRQIRGEGNSSPVT